MKDRGFSAADICRKTKIPKSTISEWLAGRQPKFDDAILRLSKILSVSVETLLPGSAPEENLVKQIFESSDDGFVEIHNGIFRVKIEKYTGNKK